MKQHAGLFKPGQSGNPKGRPKKFTIKDYITPEDVEVLVKKALELAKDGKTDMVKFLLEQAFGKAPQSIDHTTLGEKLIPIYGGQSVKSIQGHEGDAEDIQSKEEN